MLPLKHTDRRGTVAILSAIVVVVLVALLGLALDTALVLTARQQLQRTADACALAAAAKLADPAEVHPAFPLSRAAAMAIAANSENAIIRCGTAGITLDANVANVDDPANHQGDIVVGRWKFDTSSHHFVFERYDPDLPTFDPDAVRVRAKCASDASLNSSLELTFGYLFGTSTSQVGCEAIARVGRADDPLILVLHPSNRGALQINGGPYMNVQAGTIQVDSSHACAFLVNGVSGLLEAQRTRVVGGACIDPGTLTGDLITGCPYVPDPLAMLAEPTTVGMPDRGQITAPGTYDPGYYPRGVDVSGGTITLNPGIYVFGGQGHSRGIQLTGDAFLRGLGVLVYMQAGARIEITGSGAGMQLAPMASGIYHDAGVTVFQGRTSTSGSRITGGGVFEVRGTYYVPNGLLEIGGDTTRRIGRIIVNELLLFGNSQFLITGEDVPPPTGRLAVFLVR